MGEVVSQPLHQAPLTLNITGRYELTMSPTSIDRWGGEGTCRGFLHCVLNAPDYASVPLSLDSSSHFLTLTFTFGRRVSAVSILMSLLRKGEGLCPQITIALWLHGC